MIGMKSLIISDKLKSGLPEIILDEINKKEVDVFLKPHELGIMSDRCVNNQSELKGGAFGLNDHTSHTNKHVFLQRKSTTRCFSCGSGEHLSNSTNCPNFRPKFANAFNNAGPHKQMPQTNFKPRTSLNNNVNHYNNQRFNNVKQGVDFGASRDRSSSSCAFCGKPNHHFLQCIERKKSIPCNFCHRFNHASSMCRFKDRQVNYIHARVNTQTNMERCHEGKSRYLPDTLISNSADNDCDLDVAKLLVLSDLHENNQLSNEIALTGDNSEKFDVARLVCIQENSDSQQGIEYNKIHNRREGQATIPTGIIEIGRSKGSNHRRFGNRYQCYK
jgi:hypothetical protein